MNLLVFTVFAMSFSTIFYSFMSISACIFAGAFISFAVIVLINFYFGITLFDELKWHEDGCPRDY